VAKETAVASGDPVEPILLTGSAIRKVAPTVPVLASEDVRYTIENGMRRRSLDRVLTPPFDCFRGRLRTPNGWVAVSRAADTAVAGRRCAGSPTSRSSPTNNLASIAVERYAFACPPRQKLRDAADLSVRITIAGRSVDAN
jgi:hypothetical protein